MSQTFYIIMLWYAIYSRENENEKVTEEFAPWHFVSGDQYAVPQWGKNWWTYLSLVHKIALVILTDMFVALDPHLCTFIQAMASKSVTFSGFFSLAYAQLSIKARYSPIENRTRIEAFINRYQ